jgi:hypothetical protein
LSLVEFIIFQYARASESGHRSFLFSRPRFTAFTKKGFGVPAP